MTKTKRLMAELTQEEEKYASLLTQISNYHQKKYPSPAERQWYTRITRARYFTEAKIQQLNRDLNLAQDERAQAYQACYDKLQEILPPDVFQEFLKSSKIE